MVKLVISKTGRLHSLKLDTSTVSYASVITTELCWKGESSEPKIGDLGAMEFAENSPSTSMLRFQFRIWKQSINMRANQCCKSKSNCLHLLIYSGKSQPACFLFFLKKKKNKHFFFLRHFLYLAKLKVCRFVLCRFAYFWDPPCMVSVVNTVSLQLPATGITSIFRKVNVAELVTFHSPLSLQQVPCTCHYTWTAFIALFKSLSGMDHVLSFSFQFFI